jgi:hypothetical protein
MLRKSLTILGFLLVSYAPCQEKLNYQIKRTELAPKIDGVLDDLAWQEAEEAKNFTEFRPDMGNSEIEGEETIVKMTYDDSAIYFAAYNHDKPENIMKQFTTRDNFGIGDFFLIAINPNNDGQNDLEFLVFSTGTQGDAIATTNGGEDWGWNAVWDSAVKMVDDGWIVEIKLPYSALRFSNKGEHIWGVNFHRRHMRNNRQLSWSPLDLSTGKKIGLFHGEIHGIKDINPPVRSAFYPFTSSITRSFDGESDGDFNFGMDLKYGITENFTLDATLVPDFSQAGFDDVELNLGPFEQEFSEQRQFFKEGVDLFNKGNLFYSRRIGSRPTGFPSLGSNEEISKYPNSVKVLNAMKLSGRTKNSLGLAVFNAITEKTYATIENLDTQVKRREVVEPLSNYNIFVLDQQFGGNSSISLVNTNVTRSGHFRDANVTAAIFDINNKKNTYNFEGQFKLSHLNLLDDTQTGFSSKLGFNKISGNYRFGIDYEMTNKKYDINDMGIQFRNNFQNYQTYFNYRTFEPKGRFNQIFFNLFFNYRRLYEPDTYTGMNIGVFYRLQTKKLMHYRGFISLSPGKQYDYWEPRKDGRFYTYKNVLVSEVNFDTNQAKRLALSSEVQMMTLFDPVRDQFRKSIEIGPRFRFTDKLIVRYGFDYIHSIGGRGFVTNLNDDIIFGQRRQQTIEHSIQGNFNFNSFHGLSLTFRNYWSTVTYDHRLYELLQDGSQDNSTGYTVDNIGFNPNVNFNTWNLDFKYSWQFAPGSQLTALYRNSLFNLDNMSNNNFFNSLDTLFDQPIEHIFSLRMVYFIDYNNVKNVFVKG